jgi:tetratricopeptide (TPR) repeat protein
MPPRSARFSRSFMLVGLIAGLATGLPAQAQQETAEPPALDAGAFLSARVASTHADYAAAADWYARALLADPKNPAMLDGAILANIALGELDPAATMARALEGMSGKTEISHLALLIAESRDQNFAALVARTAEGVKAGALLDSLIAAWAHVGQGRMTDATAIFDTLSKAQGMSAFGLYHKAMALAFAGDLEGADAILSGKAAGSVELTRRGFVAHAQILSQLERNADAIAVLNAHFDAASDPEIAALLRRLEAGEPVPQDSVTSPVEGIAEVFHNLAAALSQEDKGTQTLIYARGAEQLRPTVLEYALLTADLLEDQGQHDLAIAVYSAVPADHPMSYIAEIGRADASQAAGRTEAAIEALKGLVRTKPDVLAGHFALADALRRNERFAEARDAYTAALDLIPEVQPQHWTLFFSRGICAERLGDFDATVADMREALRLNPDHPQVLNYLGYTFVDRGENLEEALSMIERAVAKEPSAGYIIDSLAWAYYRLGRYADAVAPMEQASLLEPVDPIVTDHLGDIYWAVGRKREAEFQWSRALSYGPEEKDAVRIRAKLAKGLDAVLAEEGATAIAPVEAKAEE